MLPPIRGGENAEYKFLGNRRKAPPSCLRKHLPNLAWQGSGKLAAGSNRARPPRDSTNPSYGCPGRQRTRIPHSTLSFQRTPTTALLLAGCAAARTRHDGDQPIPKVVARHRLWLGIRPAKV